MHEKEDLLGGGADGDVGLHLPVLGKQRPPRLSSDGVATSNHPRMRSSGGCC